LGLPHARAKTWKYFNAFWARPWFRRIWVIQEFVLAKDITMICGEWEGSWEFFSLVIVKINEYKLHLVSSQLHVGDYNDQLKASVGVMLMVMICTRRALADWNGYVVYRLTILLETGDTLLKESEGVEPYLAAMAMILKSNPNIAWEFSRLRQNDAFDRYAYFGLRRSRKTSRKPPGKPPGSPLTEVITMLGPAEATVPSDRLFALLNLANDLDEHELQLFVLGIKKK
jgi:hypothetical protein